MNELISNDAHDAQTKSDRGMQASLCRNSIPAYCSHLNFISHDFVSEDDALDYLAEVLVGAFLDHKKYYANTTFKKSSNLLSSINKRTS